ncbi:UNKNOWN [Stylonychia lemnae]|uniref:Uncharacterized protein n=1 Tax=Stylonychia lemnae TaxID=5949 RepID=A0A078B4Y1_STYLE|nr:UNKNOWN [Stylonychia lemnae]|eukprot:CDW89479.1 UNKNOWN [Stylonychia lemnae]
MDRRRRSFRKQTLCKRFLRPLDIYGRPVQLTYQGQYEFKTTFGGGVSLIMITLFLLVSVQQVYDLILRKQSSYQQSQMYFNQEDFQSDHDISSKNFSMAFMLTDNNEEKVYSDLFYGQFSL